MENEKLKQDKVVSFTSETLLADVILTNYRLIPIISRFNIQFGFGNKNVKQICEYYKIDSNFFLEIINYYHNPKYFPISELQSFSSETIVKFLLDTHRYFRNVRLPKVQSYIDDMLKELSEVSQFNVKLLSDFYKNYKSELEKHLDKEEEHVFPYAIVLEQAELNCVYTDNLVNSVPIEQYKNNHAEMEITLSDLKNLIIRHLSPVMCYDLCQSLLLELFRLEEELEYHSLIEEKVLMPKLKTLETKIRNRRD